VLAAAQRLRRREEFVATIRAGWRAGRGFVVVHVDAPDARPADTGVCTDSAPVPAGRADLPPRVGFIIPKTVGKAVARNKVRRRLRHLVSERLEELPAGTAVVVRALPGAADRGYSALADDLDAALAAVRSRRSRRPPREGT
jgi:ribonuclease P protein component